MLALVAACGGPRSASAPTAAPIPALPATSGTPAPAPARPHVIPKQTADVHVTVTGLQVTINGIAVSNKPMVADFVAIFGKPDRTWDQGGANKVHTWDKIGLLVYEPYDGRCISATFPYKPMSQSFNPATMFGGSIIVDGNKLTPATSLATVKKWPGATIPYSPSSVVFDKLDMHVFTMEESAPMGVIDLVELSFWQRGKRGEAVDELDEEPLTDRAGVLEVECKARDARACVRLALFCQTGVGAERDLERAFGFAKQGCEGGDAFGCTMLGNMYEAGSGTAASKDNARAAWRRACSLGDRAGCERAR